MMRIRRDVKWDWRVLPAQQMKEEIERGDSPATIAAATLPNYSKVADPFFVHAPWLAVLVVVHSPKPNWKEWRPGLDVSA